MALFDLKANSLKRMLVENYEEWAGVKPASATWFEGLQRK